MTTLRLRPRWKRADLAFLGLALAAHALMLLVPLAERIEKLPFQPRLTLELVNWRARPATVVNQKNEFMPKTVGPVEPKPPEPRVDAQILEAPASDEALPDRLAEPESAAPESTASPARLTAALLMNAAGRREIPRGETDPAQKLGVHTPRGLPANWRRGNEPGGLLTDEPGLDVAFAPADTEIVDRWLDTQGAHNVVLTLPNGETVCGRAQAWDPMQPLVEHIMMYRSCGGGGKRTFDMASRPTPLWSTAE